MKPYRQKRKPLKDMSTSERKQSFFRWLLRKGVTRSEAALITHKKFYHGDPFIDRYGGNEL